MTTTPTYCSCRTTPAARSCRSSRLSSHWTDGGGGGQTRLFSPRAEPLTPIDRHRPPRAACFAGDDPLGEYVADSELAPFKPRGCAADGSCSCHAGRPSGAGAGRRIFPWALSANASRCLVTAAGKWFLQREAPAITTIHDDALTCGRAYGGSRLATIQSAADATASICRIWNIPNGCWQGKSPQPPARRPVQSIRCGARAPSASARFLHAWLKQHAPAYPARF
jgi:hypothetical protein